MEFPDLGKHCSESNCKQLDFLPMKCDSCQKIFCKDHFVYVNHNCPEAYRKDNQVPVCPLCNSPISVKKGQQADYVVGHHIDNDCQSDPAKQKRKVYSNKCHMKGCKHKELIPITCDRCKKNFCLKHRLDSDHNCAGFEGSGRGISNAGSAAVSRNQASASTSNGPFKTSQNKPQLRQQKLTEMGRDLDRERRERATGPSGGGSARTFQAGLSEDEAMARALAMSMQDSQPTNQTNVPRTASQQEQEEADAALARALQASEEEAATARRQPQQPQQSSREKSSCSMS